MKLSRRLLKISCSVLLLSVSAKLNAMEYKDPQNLLPKFIEHMSNSSFENDFVLGDIAVGEQRICADTCFLDSYSRMVVEKTDNLAKVETYDAEGKSVDVEIVHKEEYETTPLQISRKDLNEKVEMAFGKLQSKMQIQELNSVKTYVQVDALLIVGSFASLNLSGKLCDDATGSCDSFLMNLNFSNAETYLTKMLEANFQVSGFRLSNIIEKKK